MSSVLLPEPQTATGVAVVNLVKCYMSGPEEIRAVDGVTFELEPGTFVALQGQSGCGKSTLLNLLGALDKPDSGTIRVAGVEVEALRGSAETGYRRRKVGFVFQSFNLIPRLTALENVMLPMEFTGVPGAQREQRAHRLLAHVGIEPRRQEHRPAKLSGGQQQRVAIARALANDPPLILADEPTANLDSSTGRKIVSLLHDLSREGRTVLVATHNAAVARRADRVLEMDDGRIR